MKTKKLILMFFIVAISLLLIGKTSNAATSGTATTTTKNGGTISWSFSISEDAKQITSLKCTNTAGISGEIEIPSTINIDGTDYTVVSLSHKAFAGAAAVTKITIPDTITLMEHIQS